MSDHPDRPTHPDFVALSAMIRGFDGEAEASDDQGEATIEGLVQASDIDAYTLAYVAMQRGMRAVEQIPLLPGASPETTHAASWLEGFTLGAAWQRQKEGP